jgi:hypothetical protein
MINPLDIQVGGDHYKDCAIQPVQYIEANKLQFLEGCVVKRCTRHDKPTGKGRQDIEKAIHELQLLLELRYPVEPEQIETTDLGSMQRAFTPAVKPDGATHYWPQEGKYFKLCGAGWMAEGLNAT